MTTVTRLRRLLASIDTADETLADCRPVGEREVRHLELARRCLRRARTEIHNAIVWMSDDNGRVSDSSK